jgi:hypothetical protein
MNKHTIVTLIAIIVIVVPFAYSGLNIYAAEQLKFRWSEPEKFDYLSMSNDGKMEFCNPLPYNVNFKNFQIITLYDSHNKGVFTVDSLNITPSASIIQNGIFSTDEYNVAKQLFMQMDFEFDGGDISIDPSKMFVLVSINTPIIGVIPYSTTTEYTGFNFDKIMKDRDFDC